MKTKLNTFLTAEGEEHCAICHGESNGCNHPITETHKISNKYWCSKCYFSRPLHVTDQDWKKHKHI